MENAPQALLGHFQHLFDAGSLTDAVVEYKGPAGARASWRVHKAVLAQSAYLLATMTNEEAEEAVPVDGQAPRGATQFIIEGDGVTVTPDSVEACVKALYGIAPTLSQAQLGPLLETAGYLDVPTIPSLVADFVFQNLNVANVVDCAKLTHDREFGEPGTLISDASFAFLARNAPEVGPGRLAELPLALQVRLFTAPETFCRSEYERYRLAVATKVRARAMLLQASHADVAQALVRLQQRAAARGLGTDGTDATAASGAGNAGDGVGGDDGEVGGVADASILTALNGAIARLDSLLRASQSETDGRSAGERTAHESVERRGTGPGRARRAALAAPSALSGSDPDPFQSTYTPAPPPSPAHGVQPAAGGVDRDWVRALTGLLDVAVESAESYVRGLTASARARAAHATALLGAAAARSSEGIGSGASRRLDMYRRLSAAVGVARRGSRDQGEAGASISDVADRRGGAPALLPHACGSSMGPRASAAGSHESRPVWTTSMSSSVSESGTGKDADDRAGSRSGGSAGSEVAGSSALPRSVHDSEVSASTGLASLSVQASIATSVGSQGNRAPSITAVRRADESRDDDEDDDGCDGTSTLAEAGTDSASGSRGFASPIPSIIPRAAAAGIPRAAAGALEVTHDFTGSPLPPGLAASASLSDERPAATGLLAAARREAERSLASHLYGDGSEEHDAVAAAAALRRRHAVAAAVGADTTARHHHGHRHHHHHRHHHGLQTAPHATVSGVLSRANPRIAAPAAPVGVPGSSNGGAPLLQWAHFPSPLGARGASMRAAASAASISEVSRENQLPFISAGSGGLSASASASDEAATAEFGRGQRGGRGIVGDAHSSSTRFSDDFRPSSRGSEGRLRPRSTRDASGASAASSPSAIGTAYGTFAPPQLLGPSAFAALPSSPSAGDQGGLSHTGVSSSIVLPSPGTRARIIVASPSSHGQQQAEATDRERAQRDFERELCDLEAAYDDVFASLHFIHMTDAQLRDVASDGDVPPQLLRDARGAREVMRAKLARAADLNVRRLSELPEASDDALTQQLAGVTWPPLRFGVEVTGVFADAMVPSDESPEPQLSSDRVYALGSLWSLDLKRYLSADDGNEYVAVYLRRRSTRAGFFAPDAGGLGADSDAFEDARDLVTLGFSLRLCGAPGAPTSNSIAGRSTAGKVFGVADSSSWGWQTFLNASSVLTERPWATGDSLRFIVTLDAM